MAVACSAPHALQEPLSVIRHRRGPSHALHEHLFAMAAENPQATEEYGLHSAARGAGTPPPAALGPAAGAADRTAAWASASPPPADAQPCAAPAPAPAPAPPPSAPSPGPPPAADAPPPAARSPPPRFAQQQSSMTALDELTASFARLYGAGAGGGAAGSSGGGDGAAAAASGAPLLLQHQRAASSPGALRASATPFAFEAASGAFASAASAQHFGAHAGPGGESPAGSLWSPAAQQARPLESPHSAHHHRHHGGQHHQHHHHQGDAMHEQQAFSQATAAAAAAAAAAASSRRDAGAGPGLLSPQRSGSGPGHDPYCKPNNHLYKTELCKNWSALGTCRYGVKCQFAHGTLELRPATRPPRAKSDLCRTFAVTGTCAYGPRCRFQHADGAAPAGAAASPGGAGAPSPSGAGHGGLGGGGGAAAAAAAQQRLLAMYGGGPGGLQFHAGAGAGDAAAAFELGGLHGGFSYPGLGDVAMMGGGSPIAPGGPGALLGPAGDLLSPLGGFSPSAAAGSFASPGGGGGGGGGGAGLPPSLLGALGGGASGTAAAAAAVAATLGLSPADVAALLGGTGSGALPSMGQQQQQAASSPFLASAASAHQLHFSDLHGSSSPAPAPHAYSLPAAGLPSPAGLAAGAGGFLDASPGAQQALVGLASGGSLSAAGSTWPSALASPAAAAALGGRAGSSYGSLSAPLFGAAGSLRGPLSSGGPCWDAGASLVGSPSNPLGAVGSPPPSLRRQAEGVGNGGGGGVTTSEGLFLPGLQSLGYAPTAPSPGSEQLRAPPQASPWADAPPAASAAGLSPLGQLFPGAAGGAGRAGSPGGAPPNPLIHELLQALSQQQQQQQQQHQHQQHHHQQGGAASEWRGAGGDGGGPRAQLGPE
ncbi:hypothetical protein Rsub_12547 [Raphidocelis subcapitata]|uniref:C3H1-type domain-containing protein n=1 Tax=Raphidocelis subcapitata TaxID=307507 RepID=A0A2V0PQQ9_9CHLO|nr:hypothetical protein Rsub_12547 [Raphidocelis subcapitata]|eukprot:GBF99847.1 hypothetical protein Rsub_12547 [Raphidocelis subcapitata]